MEILNMMTRAESRLNLQMNILNSTGYTINHDSLILDFGCGRGALVKEYRKCNYKAYGCDLGGKRYDVSYYFDKEEVIREIDKEYYRLPFEDSMFDVVVSDQVLEHVNNYSEVLSEIDRVLKPGGVSLHIFPSRYRVFEAHVQAPFASIFKNYYWMSGLGHVVGHPKDFAVSGKSAAMHEITNPLRNQAIIRNR